MNLRLPVLIFCSIILSIQVQAQTGSYKLFFERVYLHTDREHYAAGEDIWFKAYMVNAQTSQLLNSSNNLYVEFINSDANISERKIIRMDNGLGHGDFKLGDSIVPGIYRIRAYTNWMRNFGDNFIFEKQIHIYNDIEKLLPNTTLKKEISKKTNLPDIPPAGNLKLVSQSIQFFPEGGSMIESVQGVVAIKAETASGKGTSARGNIISSAGEFITEFDTDNFGMGLIILSPEAGKKYFAQGNFSNGQPFNDELPGALVQGFSLNVRSSDSTLRVTISTNLFTLKALESKELTLTAKSKGKTLFSTKIPLKESQTSISIEKALLSGGITALTLYDANGKPQCERLVYNEVTDKASITITSDKTGYFPKGKTTLSVKATDQNNQPVKAYFSLAAIDAGIVSANESNIISYLNLQSEIRGKIDNPNQYFNENNPQRKQKLDMLLLTQGWRDFTWRRLADSALRISYALEQGITVSGRVREISAEKPITGANITLSASKFKGNNLLSYRTDSAGKYYFDGLEFYGTQLVKLTSRNNKGEKLGSLIMDSLFNKSISVKKLSDFDASFPDSSFNKKALIDRTLKIQSLSDTIQLKEVKIKGSRYVKLWDQQAITFGYPEESFQIQPKDSVFANLEHYLTVNLRHNNGIFFSGMDNNGSRIISLPRLIVNGKELTFRSETQEDVKMALDYYTTYFQLRMDKVQKVLVKHLLGQPKSYRWVEAPLDSSVKGIYYLQSPFPGGMGNEDIYVIYLTLKPGALDKKEYDVIREEVNGYYEARTFYTPKYETPDTKPDLRTTIHWEPNITTDENGEATITYYNADPKTKVRIVVEGITQNGIPVVGKAAYDVK